MRNHNLILRMRKNPQPMLNRAEEIAERYGYTLYIHQIGKSIRVNFVKC
jgi:hypothetical protein